MAPSEKRNVPRAAFTLIELLVVMSIISLVASLLLPALSSARRSSQALVCQTNLREIGSGMIQYGIDNGDWIVGAPAGSGAYLTGDTAFGPAVQVWDFMGPLARQWGLPLREARSNADTIWRFNFLRGYKGFLCPSNQFLSNRYEGPNAGVGPMVSYNTCRYILLEHENVASTSVSIGLRHYDNSHEQKLSKIWSPRITRLGDTSRKVFAADGSRYATVQIKPDYDLRARATWGGTFSDIGPYSTFTRSWDRAAMSGTGYDARIYAFRHSTAVPQEKAAANTLKMNLVFFDGHVEKLGDLQAADPRMWLPAGSKLENPSVYPDVRDHYGLQGTIEINN
jgi:prepilin-type N-terminal cleavage/methylation domain-containing protein/prepilin-type processing-associated H-X9-DG protein